MKQEIIEAIIGLKTLAEQRGWQRVVKLSDEILSEPASHSILIAISIETTDENISKWIHTADESINIRTTPLSQLEQTPELLYTADKVIVLFKAGRLFNAEDIEALNNFIFTRPEGSYAIILSNFEEIENEEDINIIQRNAWQLLVPEPKAVWNGQDLIAHQCYLWSLDPPEFLTETLRRNQQALENWLCHSGWDTTGIELQRTSFLFDLAEENLRQTENIDHVDANILEQQVVNQRDMISALSRRLVRRLDADLSAIGRQVTASLQTLGTNLQEGLRPYLTKKFLLSVKLNERELSRLLTEYVNEGYCRWESQTLQLLKKRSNEINTGMDNSLNGVDWSFINQLTAEKKLPGKYPAILLQTLGFQELITNDFKNDGFEDFSKSGGGQIKKVVHVTTATLMTAGSYFLLGVLPALGVGIGLAALMGGSYRKENLEKCINFSQAAISGAIASAIHESSEQIRKTFQPLRNNFLNSIRDLQNLLDEEIQQIGLSQSSEPSGDVSDRAILTKYRQQMFSSDNFLRNSETS